MFFSQHWIVKLFFVFCATFFFGAQTFASWAMDPFVAKDRTEEEEGEVGVDEEEEEGMTRGLTFNEVLHLLTRKAVMGPVSSSNLKLV